MNSRCICAAMRDGREGTAASCPPAAMGTRMRFPGYPSNREADERARMSLRAEKKTIETRGKTRKEPKEKNVSDAHLIF